MIIRVKYFNEAKELTRIEKGNWVDVYANETMFVEEGTAAVVPLGFALELPKGWEGHLAPRSSTFDRWGIIQTNSEGVIDDTFIGDDDQWRMPVYCLRGNDTICNGVDFDGDAVWGAPTKPKRGTWIYKGDKIGQFRIMEVMPAFEFEVVSTFNNRNRGGFGTTGDV